MSKSYRVILARELGVSPQAIGKRRDKIKTLFGPMSDIEAYGVIGHQENLDVAKLLELSSQTLSQIRGICFRIQNNGSDTIREKSTTQKNSKSQRIDRVIRIGGNLNYKDPVLPSSILNDAKRMTDIYATLYIFENSVREIITRVLTKKYGIDWWDKLNAQKAIKMRRDVKGRMKQELKNAWHGRRGNHAIHYTDIADLINIFDEYWSDFSSLFPDYKWVEMRIKEISLSRNIVDHHNPLDLNDQRRVQVYFTDWCNQIESIREKIEP